MVLNKNQHYRPFHLKFVTVELRQISCKLEVYAPLTSVISQ